jgi:predicted ArsR family transcriptional regulator
LKDKFNFSSFEAFSGENCVKIVDKIESEFDREAAEKVIEDAYKKALEEWNQKKTENEEFVKEEVKKITEAWNKENGIETEEKVENAPEEANKDDPEKSEPQVEEITEN